MSAARPRLVVGISGASGPQLGHALIRALHRLGTVETHLVITRGARRTIELELGLPRADLEALADVVHDPDDLAASISSGSFRVWAGGPWLITKGGRAVVLGPRCWVWGTSLDLLSRSPTTLWGSSRLAERAATCP